MIIFGISIHKKYHKYIIVVCLLIVSLFIFSCNKINFDPTTTSIKYILQKDK